MIMNKSLGTKLKEKVNAKIYEWKANTVYEVDDVVIESNVLYKCIIRHTSSVFANEGSKWLAINVGGGASSSSSSLEYSQVKANGPLTFYLTVRNPLGNWCYPPVEVLKYYGALSLYQKGVYGTDFKYYYDAAIIQAEVKYSQLYISLLTSDYYLINYWGGDSLIHPV